MIDKIRHFFIPHHTNNFRARVLHYDFFLLYTVLFLILSFSLRSLVRINPDILGYATDIRIEELLTLTNQKRRDAGLSELNLNKQLSQAASGKAAHMYSQNYWSHVAPDGTTPWDFINGAGYIYTVAGENLAKNFSNSAGVIEAWMNSPTHRENITRKDYKEIGFAIVNGVLNGEETTLVVQMFGNPLSQPVAKKIDSQPEIDLGGAIKEVQAEELSDTQYLSEKQKSESVAGVEVPKLQNFERNTTIKPANDQVLKQPIFDLKNIYKNFSASFIGLLIFIMVIDAIIVWKYKIVRTSGKNLAHLIFLSLIVLVTWYMTFGQII